MGDDGAAADRTALHRFFVAPSAVAADRVTFTAEQQQQIRRVLRLRAGDRVIVLPGDGSEITAALQADGPTVWADPLDRQPGAPEPVRDIWLYQSALRGDRFTWLLQKCTEIGVRGFIPVLFRYTQPANYVSKVEHYRAVIREAAEQSRRARLPDLLAVLPFAGALDHGTAVPGATCLLLDERETSMRLHAALAAAPGTICLFVGPEGGLHDHERARARAAEVQAVSLGRRILRSETAGIAAAALALASSGDLG